MNPVHMRMPAELRSPQLPSARMRSEGYGSVCLSVCLYHAKRYLVCLYAESKVHPILRELLKSFDLWIFEKTFRSKVMESLASHQRYFRDPELIPSTAQGYKSLTGH